MVVVAEARVRLPTKPQAQAAVTEVMVAQGSEVTAAQGKALPPERLESQKANSTLAAAGQVILAQLANPAVMVAAVTGVATTKVLRTLLEAGRTARTEKAEAGVAKGIAPMTQHHLGAAVTASSWFVGSFFRSTAPSPTRTATPPNAG